MHRINGQVTDLKIMALDVLAWITCAKRPLTTVELRHALAIEPDESEFNEDNISDLDDIVSVCAGLVTVTPDASGDIIRLVHYTAQEYFERSWSRWFPDAHSNIATACVTYLSFDAFQTGICLTDADFEARLDEYPLYSYAAKYWGNHAREQPLDESVMMSLLENTPKLHACVQGIFALRSYSSYGEYSLRVPLGFTGSHLAAYFGLISAVRSITSQCDQSYMVDSMGRTPLTWAAYNGHHAVVKFYLENGVNASEMDGDGRTPLSLAASMGWFNVVSLLLEYHVDPDVRDIDDQTALSWAAYQGHVEVAQLLLQKGASPDSRDANGQTQLSWAASNGCVGIVELLLDHCVDVESQDTSGRTPLSWAAENGHAAVIQILLDKGAVPDSNDVEGYTPLSRAAQYGHQTAICLLQEKPHSPRLHIPIMDGVDCVMQNTERPLTQFSPGENLQLPLESGKVTLDKQKPKPKPAFKCSLCLGPPSWMGNSRATFKRHLDNRHFPRFSHFCFEPSCSEDGNPQPLSHRMDLCFIHFERQHKKKLNREDIERLRHENPYPENCPVCQRSIGSWKDFYSCVFDHSKIMSPPS
jgi:ankyrin repeat protein